MPAVGITDWPPTYARDHQARETYSPSRASKIYGHNAFQIIHYTPLLSTMVAQHNSSPHTVSGCAGELASALTAAIILADASVTPPSLK